MPKLKSDYYFATYFVFILVFVFPLQSSFAKMRAMQMIPANEVINYYKGEMANGKLSSDEVEIMKLANLAKEIFEVKEFAVSGYHESKTDQAKAVFIYDIANSIQQAIQKKTNWNDTLPVPKMNSLKKEANLLKKSLGENSIGWTWYLCQIGHKKEAQKILSREFERAYKETMKLTEISGFKGSSPAWEVESIYKALIPLSSGTENKSREEKIQKMRLHISNLPNMQMMT